MMNQEIKKARIAALYIAPYRRGIFNITKAPLTKGLFSCA